MATITSQRDGVVARRVVALDDVLKRDLFNPRNYSGRINCPNCGTYTMQFAGADEPEHLVVCKKCEQPFVWMVMGGRPVTIGSPTPPRVESAK